MNGLVSRELLMVRVYLTESEHRAHDLLRYLKDAGIMGATLMRGISGYGASGTLHRADWLDISGDLPLMLEFCDEEDKVEQVLPGLLEQTEPGHVLSWRVSRLSGNAE